MATHVFVVTSGLKSAQQLSNPSAVDISSKKRDVTIDFSEITVFLNASKRRIFYLTAANEQNIMGSFALGDDDKLDL